MKMWRNWFQRPFGRLALRYLTIASLFLVLIQLLFGAFQIWQTYHQQSEDLEKRINSQLEFLREIGVEHLLNNEFFVLEAFVKQNMADEDVVYTIYLSPDGRPLTRSITNPDRERHPFIVETLESGADSSLPGLFGAVRERHPVEEKQILVISQEEKIGEVWIGYSTEGLRGQFVQSAITTAATNLAATAALAVLTVVLFNQLIGRRLNEVAELAETITSGDLSARVTVTHKDEIGDLQVAFNEMTSKLQTSLDELGVSEAEQRKLNDAISRSTNLVIITDADGEIEWVNQGFVDSTGYTLDEIVGKRPGHFLQGELTDEATVQYMREQIDKRRPFQCEIINYKKTGVPYWIYIDAQPVYDDDGTVMNFIAVETDVTERKEQEETIRYRGQLDELVAAVSSEFVNCPSELVDQKIGHVLALIAKTLDADIISLSLFSTDAPPQITTQFVWPNERIAECDPYPLDTVDVWGEMLERREMNGTINVEERSVLAGHGLWTVHVVPLHEYGARRGHLMLGLVDEKVHTWEDETTAASIQFITNIVASALERKQLDIDLEDERRSLEQRTEALHTANASLAEASRMKDTFWASMSHELRTPLNAILGFSQLLERSPNITTQEHEYLDIIHNSGNHLLGLINDVLSISKMEAGRMTVSPVNFDLYRLLEKIERIFLSKALKKGIRFEIWQDDALPKHIRTDQGKLRQVLLNLVDNAVKFTHEGKVQLDVRYDSTTSQLHFAVNDTGVGIGEEEMGQLFELFSQTKSGRDTQSGTGLGLALSRQFVQLMGGDIWVKSNVGEGSTFGFVIDMELATAIVEDRPGLQQRVIGLAEVETSPRILVAEDLEDNQKLIQVLLESLGITLLIVEDGKQAVEQAVAWKPDIVLMDLRMPVMDGYEATRQIRANQLTKDVPIIAVTASALTHQDRSALDAGCNAIVHKPLQVESLLEIIAEYTGVQYVYASSDEQVVPTVSQPKLLTAASFADIPDELRDEIRTAAQQLNINQLTTLSERVKGYNEGTAATLLDLIGEFDLEPIIELA